MPSTSARHGLSPDQISRSVIDAAMKVHSRLGPGLLESAYEACLCYELKQAGFHIETQVPVPLIYDGLKLECGYRIDLLVGGKVLIEIKSVEALSPVHKAQVLSYLKLGGYSLGLLINFNVLHLKDGIRRFVMGTAWK